jgi:HB1, ASXL, restriction endonuclease HTH domain
MERDGVSEEAVQKALAEIFEGYAGGSDGSRPDRAAARPFERGSMTEAMVWVLEEEGNRAMQARELWNFIESRGLYTRSRGRTPWATIAAKLATDRQFERVARGLYRLAPLSHGHLRSGLRTRARAKPLLALSRRSS